MAKAVIWYDPVDVETYLSTGDSTYTENDTDGFELENLEDNDPSVTWRTTDILENQIIFDLTTATRTYGVFVANHNIEGDTPDTTFAWKAGTTNACADNSENITMPLTAPPHDEEYRPNSYVRMEVEKRYVGLWLDKAAGGYIEAGYIFIPTKEYQFDHDFGTPTEKFSLEFEPIMEKDENKTTGFIDKTVYKTRNVFRFQMSWNMDDEQVRKFRQIQKSNYVVFFPFGTSNQGYYGTIEFGEMIADVEENADAVCRWKSREIVFIEAVE